MTGLQLGSEPALLPLQSMYAIADSTTQYEIVTGLIQMRCTAAKSFFADVLMHNKSALIRHEAAFGLGSLGSQADADVLLLALQHDPSPIVRHEAAIALAEVGRQQDLEVLQKAAEEDELIVSESALYSIQRLMLRM